jgi:hypothetical protein
MITWREFAEVAFERTRSSSSSSSREGSIASASASEIFSGAYHYSTSSSGFTTIVGSEQTATATGSQFTFSTTFNVETSTTETFEATSFRTQSTEEEYAYTTTTSTVVTNNSETETDWTTTTETDTISAITHQSYTTQADATRTTTLTETVAGNYWNTVYQADQTGVLYVAPRVELSSWDGQGQTLNTTTRTTISAETSTLPVVGIAAFLVAGTASQPPQSLTNSSTSSSLQFTRNTSYITQITSANLLVLPHSTFVTEIIKNDSTTTTSVTDSRAQSTLTHRGNTYTEQRTYIVRKTLSSFNDTSSFAVTFADRSVATVTRTHGASFTTTERAVGGSTSASGITVAVGGASSTISVLPLCGIKSQGERVGWLIYGRSGASASNGAGLFYPITDSLSFVDQAHTRWPAGLVTIFPKTNNSYSANATGLTWTTTTAGSQTLTTKSSEISAQGEARTAFIGGQLRELLGGELGESETAVQSIGRGVYKNQTGGTSFFEGHASSYTGSQISETSYWRPVPWLGEVALFVSEVPRNSKELPDLAAEGDGIYPSEEF